MMRRNLMLITGALRVKITVPQISTFPKTNLAEDEK